MVELALASLQLGDQYRAVTIDGGFATDLRQALQTGQPFGSAYHDVVGAFPLGAENPITVAGALWDQWTVHAENIAKIKGLNAQLIASLIGAMVELQDNVYEHSGASQTGLVAYASLPGARFQRIDDGFHFIMLDQPERFADVVKAFLSS